MNIDILKKAPALAVMVICLVLFLAAYIVDWLFVSMENRGGREFWSAAFSETILDCLASEDYSGANYALRQLKTTCEKPGGEKVEYVSVLKGIKSRIPHGVSEEKLPHDLLVSDPYQVRFGLFRRGWRRLKGANRRAELVLLAGEVRSASEEGNEPVVDCYVDFLDRMNDAQLLSAEELILVKHYAQARVKRGGT